MKNSYILLHIAVVLAGFTGIFGKLISLNEVILVWYRVFISAITLYLIIKFFKISIPEDFESRLKIAKAGLLITIHWVFFYASIKYSNVSIGVVCYCLTSFFTAIFKPLVTIHKIRLSELLLSTLTLLGISLIFHFDTSYRLGIVLGVISSAFAALYTIFNERLSRNYNSVSINYFQMMGGTIGIGVLLPVYLYFHPSTQFIPNLKDGFYLILLAVFCTVGLYVVVTEVLKRIPAFTVNLTFNLEPVYAIILAFFLLGEGKEVNLSFYIGLIFIMISVVLQTLMTVKTKA